LAGCKNYEDQLTAKKSTVTKRGVLELVSWVNRGKRIISAPSATGGTLYEKPESTEIMGDLGRSLEKTQEKKIICLEEASRPLGQLLRKNQLEHRLDSKKTP